MTVTEGGPIYYLLSAERDGAVVFYLAKKVSILSRWSPRSSCTCRVSRSLNRCPASARLSARSKLVTRVHKRPINGPAGLKDPEYVLSNGNLCRSSV